MQIRYDALALPCEKLNYSKQFMPKKGSSVHEDAE